MRSGSFRDNSVSWVSAEMRGWRENMEAWCWPLPGRGSMADAKGCSRRCGAVQRCFRRPVLVEKTYMIHIQIHIYIYNDYLYITPPYKPYIILYNPRSFHFLFHCPKRAPAVLPDALLFAVLDGHGGPKPVELNLLRCMWVVPKIISLNSLKGGIYGGLYWGLHSTCV